MYYLRKIDAIFSSYANKKLVYSLWNAVSEYYYIWSLGVFYIQIILNWRPNWWGGRGRRRRSSSGNFYRYVWHKINIPFLGEESSNIRSFIFKFKWIVVKYKPQRFLFFFPLDPIIIKLKSLFTISFFWVKPLLFLL